MNVETNLPQPHRPDVLELLGYSELERRVVDLEQDNEALRATLRACLDALRHVTNDRDALRALIDHWTDERRVPNRRQLRKAA